MFGLQFLFNTVLKFRCNKFKQVKFSTSKKKSREKPTNFVTVENMNQNLRKMEYAVRGPIVVRASEIEKELQKNSKKPFSKVIKANLGDAQAMGQQPITFSRQVLALVTYPVLAEHNDFPPDVIQRAKELLSVCRGQSVGAYSDSFGIELIRKHVAEFINERDCIESDWHDILLCSGASDGIKNVLKILNEKIDDKVPGIMVPIPQYPLYSATIDEFGMCMIGYYLDESSDWELNLEELQCRLTEAEKKCCPRALVVINPGNPTGQVLSKTNIEEIIKFAFDNRLVLMADEVYQDNVYSADSKFYSFKSVINELGEPYKFMELASFMSCSKGFMGECGIRGGYCELVNFDSQVRENFSKCISAMLCPSVIGQCLLDTVVKPPKKGEPSYDLYCEEKALILDELREKGEMVYEFFNTIEGFSCNQVQGAMYAFPKVDLPKKAIQEAKKRNLAPDTFYCFQLLEKTGICVVPGSGFKQQPGTYHFRTTILPSKKELKTMLESFKKFHKEFVKRYC